MFKNIAIKGYNKVLGQVIDGTAPDQNTLPKGNFYNLDKTALKQYNIDNRWTMDLSWNIYWND